MVVTPCSSVGQADSPIRASRVAFPPGPGRKTTVSPGPTSCRTAGCGVGMSRMLETNTTSVPADGVSDRTCSVARCWAAAPPRSIQVLEASNRSSVVMEAMRSKRPVLSVKRSASASPATGSPKAHEVEQKTLLTLAFTTKG